MTSHLLLLVVGRHLGLDLALLLEDHLRLRRHRNVPPLLACNNDIMGQGLMTRKYNFVHINLRFIGHSTINLGQKTRDTFIIVM